MTDVVKVENVGDTTGGPGPEDRGVPSGVVDWRAVASATGPGDRAAAEAGVRLAYRRAGLPEPERLVWTRSPREAVRLLRGDLSSAQVPAADAAAVAARGASVREALRSRPWAAERAALHQRLGTRGWSAHWQAVGAEMWESTRIPVDRVWSGVIEELAEHRKDETRIRLLLLEAVLGQHDAAWLSVLDTGPGSRMEGLATAAGEAGWWWPYERVAVLSERPTELHRDEVGRLDREDGPALAYADGFALHAWRGMPVSGDFLASLRHLTADHIRTEENAELRRVMLEHYGYDRYLHESGAVPVGRDEAGVLWRIPLPDDEDVVMVEVVNSTPEPDGSHRTYWLRVPPTTRTAREGVAWTFGLGVEAYEPLRQT
ncbi:DUF6745 domain-containing protein [Streptomyces sp. NPDC005438]|uniref:DUF6745 domain-containing protein n=1 Tax=Streptomyces sp. NPDC005438 TaxID=3156880 RepID=UPI0033A42FD5